jgi:hypothetical protein
MVGATNDAKSGIKARPLSSPDRYFACGDTNVGCGPDSRVPAEPPAPPTAPPAAVADAMPTITPTALGEAALEAAKACSRLWIQGNSGMGKTALFCHVTEAHFRDHDSAFAAFTRWGCLVIAFAARDFASGEDKLDPSWVIDAVRATLSSLGVTFADDKLLRRFLESGTIGVAIDGLNEVGRTMAVTAFSQIFEAAPMLVTSQELGARASPLGVCRRTSAASRGYATIAPG